jgi:hypothetical protein
LNWEDDGVSSRSRLEQVWKQTGVMPKELELPPLPFELLYLREIFWDIWSQDGWSWNEVYHYQLVYDIILGEDDIFLLRDAFGACSKFVRQKMRPKKKTNAPPVARGGRK